MKHIEENSQLLIQATKHGNAIEVQRLIPISDPKMHDSLALRLAAVEDHTECVQLLIPVSDPKSGNSWALRWAALHGHTDCVDLLFDVSDADVALKRLKTGFPKTPPKIWQYLEDQITVQRQRALLTQETSHVLSSIKTRKL